MFGLAKQEDVDYLRDELRLIRDAYWELERKHHLLLSHLDLKEETTTKTELVHAEGK